ncbi:DMT family transporter [Ahrensia sp. R2A130]|uniref:DMT family transporter n=1 Tax=Ahrensia sp. R2A130 TaxID=744979 RepID=UPI0001E0D114|nr:DMT family transporter [Ahrensia sp. R2A130]EFL88865.1 LysR family transcriptional regulator [Ahrensia sp. R2A130]
MPLPARLLFLTALTMVAFAGNSILNRLALADGEIGPANFAVLRVVSGAAVLLMLVALRAKKERAPSPIDPKSVLALATYLLGFSYAYVTLPTGIGALILFGGVQVTMFAGALVKRETITRARWFGAALAFGGVVLLLAPIGGEGSAPNLGGALLMGAAAIGWGIYSLIGRTATDPLRQTQTNFLWAVPLVAIVALTFADSTAITTTGIVLAVASGAITSGLGYALWYTVLPKLETITAAVAQLTVPALAMVGGMVMLGEPLTLRFVMASVLIAGGVVVASRRKKLAQRDRAD